MLAHSLDLLMGGKARPQIVRPGAERGLGRGGLRPARGAARRAGARRARRAAAGGGRGGRARPAGLGRGPDQRLRRRPRRHGRRPEAARRAPARLLRPARAPPADDLLGPAGDPRRLRRGRAPGAAAAYREAHRECGRLAAELAELREREARGSATSTSTATSSRRSRRSRPIPPSGPSWRPSASGCAARREMPLQIYLTESGCPLEQLGENVIEPARRRTAAAWWSSARGSTSATSRDARQLRPRPVRLQPDHGRAGGRQLPEHAEVPRPGQGRGQVPGTDQRNAIAYASVVDLDEAYGVGCYAVEIARKHGNGWMSTILRNRIGRVQRPVRQPRWRRWRIPSGSSPSTGSHPAGSTSPTTSSPTPAP